MFYLPTSIILIGYSIITLVYVISKWKEITFDNYEKGDYLLPDEIEKFNKEKKSIKKS